MSQTDSEYCAESYAKVLEKYALVSIQRAYFGPNGKHVHIHVVGSKPKSSLRIRVMTNISHLDDPKVRSAYTKNGIDPNYIQRMILTHLYDKFRPKPGKGSHSQAYVDWLRLRTITVTALNEDNTGRSRAQRDKIHETVLNLCRQLAASGEEHTALKAAKKRSAKTRLIAPLTRAEAAGLELDDIIDIWNTAIVKRIMRD
jgi:hypothetical protein